MKKIALFLIFATFALAADYTVVKDENPIKILTPDLQNRKTEKIILENGLKVYLISDPNAPQSAAALAVGVGSWQENSEYPGIAHFTEHLLFLGTKNYPQENTFSEFIIDSGGNRNAATFNDQTVYMFSINNQALPKALNMFSDFFISPLFTASGVGRELHAVDQEWRNYTGVDAWREQAILMSNGNPDHPNSGFTVGNEETLGHIPREAVIEWYESHYTAENMRLAVLSSLPMDELIPLVVKDFSPIPNRATEKEVLPDNIFAKNQMGHMYYIKPIKEAKKLSLVWEIPKAFNSILARQTPELIAYALSSPAKDTLYSLLKKELLVNSFSVNIDDEVAKDKFIYTANFNLTAEGMEKIDHVIEQFFQAVERIKTEGVPQYIFDEWAKMDRLNYEYQQREEAFTFIWNLGAKLLYEDFKTFPYHLTIPTAYDPEKIKSFLMSLTPSNAIYLLLADPSLMGVVPDKKEKWMGAEYAVKPISEAKLASWSALPLNPQISLPKANPYIPSAITILEKEKKGEHTITPKILADDVKAKLYFSPDTFYLTPNVAHRFAIQSPQIDGSAKSGVLLDFTLLLLQKELFSLIGEAKRAGLSASFGKEEFSFAIHIDGYSEKAHLLTKALFTNLPQLIPTQEEFASFKETLQEYYYNMTKEMPFRQALSLGRYTLTNATPSSDELQNALSSITLEQVETFCKTLFSKAYIDALLYGNLNQEMATETWKEIESAFAYQPYPKEEQKTLIVTELPSLHGPYEICEKISVSGNCALLYIDQGTSSYQKRAAQMLLSLPLGEAFYKELRTKQQTGYIAAARGTEIESTLFSFFIVQSGTYMPEELLPRFELFLENFIRTFQYKVDQNRFDHLKQMQISTLNNPLPNLFDMADRLNYLAFKKEGDFTYYKSLIDATDKLTHQEVLDFARVTFSRKNKQRLAILLSGLSPAAEDFVYERVTPEDIKSLGGT